MNQEATGKAQLSNTTTTTHQETNVTIGKSGKKICCSCPDTKQLRDECIVQHGDEHCSKLIEAHKECLRKEGFTIK